MALHLAWPQISIGLRLILSLRVCLRNPFGMMPWTALIFLLQYPFVQFRVYTGGIFDGVFAGP